MPSSPPPAARSDLWPASWLVLFLRLALGVYLVAGSLSLLVSGLPALKSGQTALPWLPVAIGTRVLVYAALLLLGGVLVVIGYRTREAAIGVAAVLVAVLVEWLALTPFHNTMNHLIPLMLFALGIAASAPKGNAFSLDALLRRPPRPVDPEATASVVVLFARLFLGAIFVVQSHSTMFGMGIRTFAQEVYVAPFAESWVPAPLLWLMGLLNAPIQIVGGTFFLLGLRTRWAAILLAAFLVSILFGHVLSDPFDKGPDVHSYAMANLLWVLVVLYFEPKGNRFSVDHLLARRAAAA